MHVIILSFSHVLLYSHKSNDERLISELTHALFVRPTGSTSSTSGCQVQAKCSVIIVIFPPPPFGFGVGATYHVTMMYDKRGEIAAKFDCVQSKVLVKGRNGK